MNYTLKKILCAALCGVFMLLAGCDIPDINGIFNLELNNSSAISSKDSPATTTSQASTSSDESNSFLEESTSTSSQQAQNSTSSSAAATTSPDTHTHSWAKTTVAPTCAQRGYTIRKCACGESSISDYVPALYHWWDTWHTTVAPTQTSEGREERSCFICFEVESRPLEKLPTHDLAAWRREVLRLVNAEREAVGLDPLEYFSEGQAAADVRTKEIGELFSHTRPDGRPWSSAISDNNIECMGAGENIAYGYRTPTAVMKGWMDSPGHRDNILKERYTHIIIGVDENYNWVQLFLTIQ